MIGGVDCTVRQPSLAFWITVLPASLKPGCGTDGATIEFYIGEMKTDQTAAWTAGFHEIQITVPEAALVRVPGAPIDPVPATSPTPANRGGGITPPDTGDGGLK